MNDAPSQSSRIKITSDNGITVVTILDGQLMSSIAIRELGEELYALAERSGHSKFILDCSRISYMASAALNKLIVFQKKVNAAKGKLVLCDLAPEVNEVFVVTRLNQKFIIEHNRAAAKEQL